MNKKNKDTKDAEELTRLERRILPLLHTPEITMKYIKQMTYKDKEALYGVLYEKFHGKKPS